MADSCGFPFLMSCSQLVNRCTPLMYKNWYDHKFLGESITWYRNVIWGSSPDMLVLAILISLTYILCAIHMVNISFKNNSTWSTWLKLSYHVSLDHLEFVQALVPLFTWYYLEHGLISFAITLKLFALYIVAFIAWFKGELCHPCALGAWQVHVPTRGEWPQRHECAHIWWGCIFLGESDPRGSFARCVEPLPLSWGSSVFRLCYELC